MGAKLKAVRTELILLGLTAVFLGGLLTVSYRDRTTATVTVTAEHALPPEEVEVTLVDLNTAEAEELATLPGIGEGLAKRILQEGGQEVPQASAAAAKKPEINTGETQEPKIVENARKKSEESTQPG